MARTARQVAALGVTMAIVTALLGFPNPILWGVLVAVLNFVPYVGAITSMAMLAMVGLQTFDGTLLVAECGDHVDKFAQEDVT